jgi:hypothetical protein
MWYVTRTGKTRNSHKILVTKPEGMTIRHRLEHNIKIYLKEIRFDHVDWIRLAQDRVEDWALVNTVMNLRLP